MAKLSKQDWLQHGLASLGSKGFTSLKADVLAKSLGVSRGSFYHHFSDLSSFHVELLDHWLEVSSLAVVTELEARDLEPKDKIEALITLVADTDNTLEPAIRAWAFTDPAVAATVADVDRARVAYIAQVLGELGLKKAAADRRATVLYLTNLGYTFLSPVLKPKEQDHVLADVISYATSPA